MDHDIYRKEQIMAGTKILICVTDEQKAAYEDAAKKSGQTVSGWLRSLADNDCDPMTVKVIVDAPDPKVATMAVTDTATKYPTTTTPAKIIKTTTIQKAGITIDVPVAASVRTCGCLYCRTERANGRTGTCGG